MTQPRHNPDPLHALIERYCDGAISADQTTVLERNLADDPRAMDAFILYMELHSQLAWDLRAQGEQADDAAEGLGEIAPTMHRLPTSDRPALAPTGRPSAANGPAFPPIAVQTYQGAFTSLSSSWPLAYLITTAIFGIGALIGAFTSISRYEEVANNHPPTAADHQFRLRPEAEVVGQITGMVDCKWADPQTAPASSHVGMRQKIVLTSGLIKIAYDTGAIVVLQGPVTYEIESNNGGFLSVGKLTGKVEAEKAKGFVVRTPTAFITDLGTEFGVDVQESGVTSAHVFRGAVQLQLAAGGRQRGQPLQLVENESALVEKRQGANEYEMRRSAVASAAFIRDAQFAKLVQERRAKPTDAASFRWPIIDKTLVAWVALANTEQRGGAALSLVNSPRFDAIVFGELASKKWMAGSHMYEQTQQDQSASTVETAGASQLIQIAIVYKGSQVAIYRNGQPYAEYNTGIVPVFEKRSFVLIGKRLLDAGDLRAETLAGAVEEARLYNVALSQEDIAALRPNEPSQIAPIGQWTFEDGTARDVTGHFPIGQLCGNARLARGRLVLDGMNSYVLVPSISKPDTEPSVDTQNHGTSNRAPKEESKTKHP